MENKTIVLTLFGKGNVISDFSVNVFDENRSGFFLHEESIVNDYCKNINELELKDDNWIYATTIRENQKIKFEKPENYTNFDMINTLDNRSIQKIIREVGSNELCKALKSAKKETLKTIIRNMSKKAARMLIEDMKYMGPVRPIDVNEARRKIVIIMRRMEYTGEITVPRFSLDKDS